MKVSHGIAIAGVGIILTLPVLILGLPFLSDDAAFHTAWYTHFSAQLWSGDPYPRWLSGMNGGLGSPVFFFYPPVPYFLTSILRPLFRNDPQGWCQLGISASVALIASGGFAYLWLKNHVDRASALAAAILYMAMPYHLAADLYVRASFAEYWAFVWMPLILYSSDRLHSGQMSALPGLAVGWALLIMTHLPTTLTFCVLPFCYVMFFTLRAERLKVLGLSLGALMLGIGLSAIYLVPALTTQQFVLLDRISTGYFSYENWFFFARFSLWEPDKIALALLASNMLGVASCAFLISRSGLDARLKKMNVFWYCIVVGSIFMMTQLSKPVWLLVPIIRKIQFPWRFNAVLTLATAALLALSIRSLNKRSSSWLRAMQIITGLFIAVWIPVTAWKAWSAYPQTNPNRAVIEYRTEQLEQSRDAPEYRPRWNQSMASIDWQKSVDEDLWDALMKEESETLLQRVGSSPGHPPEPMIVEGVGRAEITARKPREIDLHVEASDGVILNVPQFYYPYWKGYQSGEAAELTVTPSQPDGLISLSVPRGNHDIQLRLERGKPELIGQLISLASIAIALSLALYLGKKRVNYTRVL